MTGGSPGLGLGRTVRRLGPLRPPEMAVPGFPSGREVRTSELLLRRVVGASPMSIESIRLP